MRNTWIISLLGACVIAGAAAIGGSDTAFGHGKRLDIYTLKRVVNTVAAQDMLTYTMCTHALLIAMDMDAQEQVDRLRETRGVFERNLKGLRHGDSEVGLPVTKYATILAKISLVERQWSELDAVIAKSIVPGAVTETDIAQLSELHHQIIPAIEEVGRAYREERAIGPPSLFLHTLAISAKQRTLTQKMLNEFALIAYGYEVEGSRARLAATASEFDRTLQGLIAGDLGQMLVAPPNIEIQLQLNEISRIWGEFRPYMSAAGEGGDVDRATMRQVRLLTGRLLEETDKAVLLYEAL